MKRALKNTRQARRIILNLILVAFFVWVMVSLLQPVSIDHKTVYAEHSPKTSFRLVQNEHGENGQKITYNTNEGDLRFQAK